MKSVEIDESVDGDPEASFNRLHEILMSAREKNINTKKSALIKESILPIHG